MLRSLVGSEMCIRDRDSSREQGGHGNGQRLQHSAWASWLTSDEREEIYSSNFFEDSRKYGT